MNTFNKGGFRDLAAEAAEEEIEMSTDTLIGKYHPDPEINEGIAADAREGEVADLSAGFAPRPWECECGAAHGRGHFQVFTTHRCLRCGYIGRGGRLMDPQEFTPPAHDYSGGD